MKTDLYFFNTKASCSNIRLGALKSAYISHTLSGEQHLSFEQHLRECIACAVQIYNYRSIEQYKKSPPPSRVSTNFQKSATDIAIPVIIDVSGHFTTPLTESTGAKNNLTTLSGRQEEDRVSAIEARPREKSGDGNGEKALPLVNRPPTKTGKHAITARNDGTSKHDQSPDGKLLTTIEDSAITASLGGRKEKVCTSSAFDRSRPRIKVIGVGGCGGNAINRMIEDGIEGVEFISINTDAQALRASLAPEKLQIGSKLTRGMGAGTNPEVGRLAALEDTDRITALLEGANMVFVAAGLGRGTGTGAAPIIANLASQNGALTVAFVTKPFLLEGRKRKLNAERGLMVLKDCADTVISIPNEKLLHTVGRDISIVEAFHTADYLLHESLRTVSSLISTPTAINPDFEDIKAVMSRRGMTFIGVGLSQGPNRAIQAAQKAISSPLLKEDTSMGKARAVLVNFTAASDINHYEVCQAAGTIEKWAAPEANIVFGCAVDDRMVQNKIKITVIASDITQDVPNQLAKSLRTMKEDDWLAYRLAATALYASTITRKSGFRNKRGLLERVLSNAHHRHRRFRNRSLSRSVQKSECNDKLRWLTDDDLPPLALKNRYEDR